VLRRTSNARAALKRLGHINFELLAMQVQARSYLHAGRHADAQRQMREALTIARERKAADRVVSLTTDIALSDFLLNKYETARAALENLLATDAARSDVQARIALGRIYGRLGDFKSAGTNLQQAMTTISAAGDREFAPLAYLSLGEVAYESGQLALARSHFSQAAAFWTADLPDASSIEASCNEGVLDSLTGRASTGTLEARVQQARAIGHVALYFRCLVDLARIEMKEGRYAQVLATLTEPAAAKDVTIGPELEAEMHHLRSQALAARGDRKGAELEAAQAGQLIDGIRASLAEPNRSGFSSRADIRSLFE
jgi:tetratricopeptide (TPR) repeat protein